MIDSIARRKAHAALQRFATGKTTNDEFEMEFPDVKGNSDRALQAIETMVWNLYDDHRVRPLTGTHAPSEAVVQLITRCLLFLESDYEYAWPVDDFMTMGPVRGLLDVVTLGALNQHLARKRDALEQKLARAGNFDVWPFINRDQYEASLHRPA